MAIARNPIFVLDCPDPVGLATFYSTLLDWPQRVDEDGSWVTITPDDVHAICFQRVEDYRAPVWPGQEHPQQVHLDVDVDDLDAADAQVLALGATKAEHQPGETFRVFLDPAGHPFCLCSG